MRVISIDPGGTSGYCYANIEDGIATYCPFQLPEDVDDFWHRLEKFEPEHLIIEGFEFRGGARKGLDLFPVQLIGVARLYCMMNRVHYWEQTASRGKGYYTDAILKKNALWVRGIPHGMDASRHLLQWFTFGYGHQFQGSDRHFAELTTLSAFD